MRYHPVLWRAAVVCVLFASAVADHSLAAADSAAGKPVIILWPGGAPGAHGTSEKDVPTLTVHLPAPDKANGCAVVICPGGGYQHLASDYEGHDVAEWFNTFGVVGFVLRYRLAPDYHHPAPMLDVQRAIRTVRAKADEWKIDPHRVGVMGFSAGGHLASTAATHFDAGHADAADPIDRQSCRPDFAVLAYPVITMTGK
ncbi:MAG TPA: alpha/beta hydrolase, partial [Planctomycetaceae bacterium]|nr:alpha/beta hydrolase [Planctomycetaceae bacterium]